MPVRDPDHVTDVIYDASELQVSINNEEADASSLCDYQAYSQGEWVREKYADHYSDYFHSDYSLIEVRNDEAQAERSLLIVSTSLGNPLERLFAENYTCVYSVDHRHYGGTIEDVLAYHEVDDVLFLMDDNGYTKDEFVEFLGA